MLTTARIRAIMLLSFGGDGVNSYMCQILYNGGEQKQFREIDTFYQLVLL